jgi:uncharacterized membrane protein YeaQ/YmgE (transglycosylase-associated protein family)
MKGGGFGVLAKIVVGILGALLGSFVAGLLGISLGDGAMVRSFSLLPVRCCCY